MNEGLKVQKTQSNYFSYFFFHSFLKAFDWPIEGLLVPKSPPMKRSVCKKAGQCGPVRLRILRNGDKKKSRPLVFGSDISLGQKSQ